MNNNPKVSVVTTTYNDIENLRRILSQVRLQSYPHIEHIVVDGGSTDGTVELLREAALGNEESFRWISEPDHGIYDAINKGIRMASGDIIGYCCDRYAHDQVVERMVDIMTREGTDGVHGDLCYMDGERVVRTWKQGQGHIRSGWMPGHPTLYLRREVYERYGLYKTGYRISGDYEFMVRILYKNQVRLSYLPETLIYMSYGGTSNRSLGAYLESLKEGHRALKENGVPFACITDALRTFRVLAQFLPFH